MLVTWRSLTRQFRVEQTQSQGAAVRESCLLSCQVYGEDLTLVASDDGDFVNVMESTRWMVEHRNILLVSAHASDAFVEKFKKFVVEEGLMDDQLFNCDETGPHIFDKCPAWLEYQQEATIHIQCCCGEEVVGIGIQETP